MLCEVRILPAPILKKEKWSTITDHHVHFMIEALEKCNLKAAQNCLKVPIKEASQYRRMVENEVNNIPNQHFSLLKNDENDLMVMEKTFQIFKCLYKQM